MPSNRNIAKCRENFQNTRRSWSDQQDSWKRSNWIRVTVRKCRYPTNFPPRLNPPLKILSIRSNYPKVSFGWQSPLPRLTFDSRYSLPRLESSPEASFLITPFVSVPESSAKASVYTLAHRGVVYVAGYRSGRMCWGGWNGRLAAFMRVPGPEIEKHPSER